MIILITSQFFFLKATPRNILDYLPNTDPWAASGTQQSDTKVGSEPQSDTKVGSEPPSAVSSRTNRVDGEGRIILTSSDEDEPNAKLPLLQRTLQRQKTLGHRVVEPVKRRSVPLLQIKPNVRQNVSNVQ